MRTHQSLISTATSAAIPAALALLLTACGGDNGGGGTNTAPLADITAVSDALEGSRITLDASNSSDADNDTLTFSWSQTAGPDAVQTIADADTFSITLPDVSAPTKLTFSVVVSDGVVEVSGEVSLTVNPLTLTADASNIKQITFEWPAGLTPHHYRLLQNVDGVSGFSVLEDDIPADATAVTRTVALHEAFDDRYLLEACLDDACTQTVSTPEITLDHAVATAAIGYVKASNTDGDDRFGISVVLSDDGRTLAVGAYGEESDATGVNGDQTSNNTIDAGAVYVFRRNSEDEWAQEAYVKASNTGVGDKFGRSLALSNDGSTLAVGAALEDSDATGVNGNEADDTASAAGAVYVFRRDSSDDWTQKAYVKASNTEAGDQFGRSVALSDDGSTLAVGAHREDSNATGIDGDQNNDVASNVNAGAVYVFRRDSSDDWAQEAYVKASNTGAGDQFGVSVALSDDGSTLAVGAFGEDSDATGVNGDQTSNNAAEAGAVYVFRRDGSDDWAQEAYVKASNTGAGDLFGTYVALNNDGNTLAVGAYEEDSDTTGIDGTPNEGATNAGAVYVFRRDSSDDWTQEAYVKASNTGNSDGFGFFVALNGDGNSLAVGAYGEDSEASGIDQDQTNNDAETAGAVYVFRHDGTSWRQAAYVKAPNTGKGDRFGTSIALNGDGKTLAVGAYLEGSDATGINGDSINDDEQFAGAVFLY